MAEVERLISAPRRAGALSHLLGTIVCQMTVQRFRDGLVLKAHRLLVSPTSRLESNKEEEEDDFFCQKVVDINP